MGEENPAHTTDDVRDLCGAVKELLEQAGYGVVIIHDGQSDRVWAERSDRDEAEKLRASCRR